MTPLWVADLRGGAPQQVTIIGIVANAHGQNYGLMGSPQTFAPVEVFTTIALIYWGLTALIAAGSRFLERRLQPHAVAVRASQF